MRFCELIILQILNFVVLKSRIFCIYEKVDIIKIVVTDEIAKCLDDVGIVEMIDVFGIFFVNPSL